MKSWTLIILLALAPSCDPQEETVAPVTPAVAGEGGGESKTGSSPGLLLRGGAVFDGLVLRKSTDVRIIDNLIADVSDELLAHPEDEVVDVSGMVILPGFIDAHTHTFEARQLHQAARFGVTTELDMLADPTHIARVRNQAGDGPVAELHTAGYGVLAPDGFGTDFLPNVEILQNPQNADRFVDKRLAEGSRFIKILQDDGSTWGLNWGELDPGLVAPVIAAAHARNVLAVIHAPVVEHVEHALANDADGLLSLYAGGSNEQLVKRFEDTGAFITPTMSFMLSLCGESIGTQLAADPHIAKRLDEKSATKLGETFPGTNLSCAPFRVALRELAESSAEILIGTDAPQSGVAHGASVHAELSLLVDAGRTPTEALRAATEAPARVFGFSDRGRIAEGLRADLLVVRGDPTEDITHTRAIEHVFVAGKRYPEQQ